MGGHTEQPSQRWEFPTDDFVLTAPVIDDGTVYIGSGDRNLYAIDATTGDLEQSTTLDGSIIGHPLITDDTIYVGSCGPRGGLLYALDRASLSTDWTYGTVDDVMSTPVLTDKHILVHDLRESLYGIDTVDGTLEWYVDNKTDTDIEATPAVYNDESVVAWAGMDILVAVDTTSGKNTWTTLIGPNEDRIDIGCRETSPILYEETAYVPAGDGRLLGFDCSTGSQQAAIHVDAQIVTTPRHAGGTAYVVTTAGTLHAVDLDNATVEWTATVGDPASFSAAYETSLYGDTVYITDSNNLYSFDATSGEEQWSTFIGCDATAPIVTEQSLYLGCKPAGSLLCLERHTP